MEGFRGLEQKYFLQALADSENTRIFATHLKQCPTRCGSSVG